MNAERFFADAMLGKLARWLRICGLDTCYENDIDDNDLKRRAQEQNRIILTRDRSLMAGLPPEHGIFIHDDNIAFQLREFFSVTGLDPMVNAFTRCIECNLPFDIVEPDQVAGKVPQYVFEHQSDFRRCPGCGKIFWPATHKEAMERQLQAIFSPLVDDKDE